MDLGFFTTLKSGWLTAWIPSLALVLIQFLFMMLNKEGGKRAVDTSWYNLRDKVMGSLSFFLQFMMLIVSICLPFKFGTAWFVVGAGIYALSMAAFISAFHAYGATPMKQTVTRGIYRWSRNPMYLSFHIGMLGVCIATASLWLLTTVVLFVIVVHFTILGEERYCAATYGKEYLEYKARTPRYFLWF